MPLTLAATSKWVGAEPKFIARFFWKYCKVLFLLQVSLFLLSGFSTLFSHVGLVSKPVGVSTWTQMCRPEAVGEGDSSRH